LEWWLLLIIFVVFLLTVLATGIPIAFGMLFLNAIGAAIFLGGFQTGISHVGRVMIDNLTNYALMPVVLFILMGELMFKSGMAPKMIDVIEKWLGSLPGRLSLLSVGGGALLGTVSGSTMSSVVLLGSTIVPEMEKHGYKKSMSIGPVLGSGGLAMMLPPSAFAVFLASVAQISVGRLLIAIIIPGLLMAVLYASYIIIRCLLQPSLAPAYSPEQIHFKEKLLLTLKFVVPLGSTILLIVGAIFFGIATPSEVAAVGVVWTILLAALNRKLSWQMVWNATMATTRISVMIFTIFVGAISFSQILAFSGVTQQMITWASALDIAPIILILVMMILMLGMGTILETGSIIMIVSPIFMPLIYQLGFDPIWFGVVMLLNMQMATTTPPFGVNLFALKGVVSGDTSMKDIYVAGLPFVACDWIVMFSLLAFPSLALWLPTIMY